MSYAATAAKGPKQSAEEARARPPPEVENTESISSSSLIDVDSESVHTVPSSFSSQNIQTDTQAERINREARAKEEFEAASKELNNRSKAAKGKAKKQAGEFERNSDNPVFVGNAIAVVGLSASLGFGAYRKYAAGELTWKVVGAWTGLVGLFAVGDYYLSSYLFKNKYPKK
ncbi:hypothetical protein BJ875DRAFT_452748 [Amylocarpus encephaloides]|uniref:Mitochondrial outer membrane protein OM14 C-terminal domain-containing protein n=1 Tax=Amylocarpus encephaloides TaxID=45428 RepID=A0A9P7YR93_9HELO|nr:hypothetical protein BJ875DRAFT_452748 [Amylocarpus encephaloides]